MADAAIAKPTHVVMVPYPAQGHVIPLLELAHHLAHRQGNLKITFVATEVTHNLILPASLSAQIRLVSVPDGLQPDERRVPGKYIEIVPKVMPVRVEELIHKIHKEEGRPVNCVVFDVSIGRIGHVLKTLGVRSVAFVPAAAASMVVSWNIPKMIEDGILDDQGTPLKEEAIQLAPGMAAISPSDFVWNRTKIPIMGRLIFGILVDPKNSIKESDRIICNSVHELEPGVFTLHSPRIVPIGPLLATNRAGNQVGHFQKPDLDSIGWLNQQPHNSVLYIALGSTTMLETAQLHELALGLELLNKPFLWVSRANSASYPDGFLERVCSRGRLVQWAPQQEVLSHRSIGCFLSHCGWNSTMESGSNGVPMVCWPYMADQFMNQSYICDVWGIGVRLGKGDDGGRIITCEEIKESVEQVMGGDLGFKERALNVKEMVLNSVTSGGNSDINFRDFVSWINEG